MNTEEFIRDAARRNWSKTQTREALGMCREKFWAILAAMPPIEWPKPGTSEGNKRGAASKRGVHYPKLCAHLEKARARRRERATHEVCGVRGTIEEFAATAKVSASTIRRRVNAGMSIEQAMELPPTPINHRRNGFNR